VEVGHLDGHEENTGPENLIWNCRSCNTLLGVVFKRLGIGRRTRQYNPSTEDGAHSLAQWVTAVTSLKGNGPMDIEGAIELIRATPPGRRSQFAKEIWRLRRTRD
jgi:hypothetical protein